MILVEVRGYGDLDQQYIHSLWVNEELTPQSFNARQIPDADNERSPDKIIRELKKMGFTETLAYRIEFGRKL